MKLEIYNSVHTSENVPSRVNVWLERKRETHIRRERTSEGERRRRRRGEKRRDLISYASSDHTACGTVKSPEQNTTLNNELYVHNNIFLFHFDIHMEKASGLRNNNKKKNN